MESDGLLVGLERVVSHCTAIGWRKMKKNGRRVRNVTKFVDALGGQRVAKLCYFRGICLYTSVGNISNVE